MADLPQSAADLIDTFTDDVQTVDGFHNATTFKERYPVYATLADSTVNVFLQEALMYMDTEWPNPYRLKAHGLATAHLLQAEGYLVSSLAAAAPVNLNGLADLGVSSFSIDDMSISFEGQSVKEKAEVDNFASSAYGRQFMALRKKVFGGGLVV